MPKKKVKTTKKKTQKTKTSESKLFSGLIYLACIGGFLGMIISLVLYFAKKDDPIVKYHFKQWLVLIIAYFIIIAVSIPLMFILIGFGTLLIGLIFCFVLWIMGMINAFSGIQKPLPIIGKFADRFEF
jgi:uncharacterized protein